MKRTLKVVVADDDILLGELIESWLTQCGHNVTRVFNGRQLVQHCNVELPDLVISDVQMPILDGLQAAETLFWNNPVPMILMSGSWDNAEYKRASDLGAICLEKPFRSIDLMEAIDSCCQPACGKGQRVLIVDADNDSANSLAILLRLVGCHVQVARNGRAAMMVAPDFAPEIILIDVGLWQMKTLEVVREIRAQPWGRNIRIAAHSAWGHEECRDLSLGAGCDEHLVKPVEIEALLRFIGEDSVATPVTSCMTQCTET